MKRLLQLLFLTLLGCAIPVAEHPTAPKSLLGDDYNSYAPLPVAGSSSFGADLTTFLSAEYQKERTEYGFPNFFNSGGTASSGAGLSLTPTASIFYNANVRGTENGSITFPNNSTCWVGVDENTTGSNSGLSNFTRVSGTHYLIDCIDLVAPTMTTDSQLVMEVITSGGAVITVNDERNLIAIAVFPPSANLPMGTHKFTGLAAGTTSGDSFAYSLNTINQTLAPTADFSMNTHKITHLVQGSTTSDALAFGTNHLNDLGGATGNYSMTANRLVNVGAVSLAGDALSEGHPIGGTSASTGKFTSTTTQTLIGTIESLSESGGGSVTPSGANNIVVIAINDNSAFTVANPSAFTSSSVWYLVYNNVSGGGSGTISYGADYHFNDTNATSSIASGKLRICPVVNITGSVALMGKCSGDI